MKRISVVVLGLVLIGMAVLYFLQGSGDLEDVTFVAPTGDLTLDAARIVRVDITRPASFVRLERVRGAWKLTEPVFATPDQDGIRALELALRQFRLLGMASTNPARQRLLAVDEQGTSVTFVNDDGRSINLIVGKAAPNGGSAFIRLPQSDTVYLASGLLPSVLNRDAADWRQRMLFRTSPDSISGLRIAAGRRQFDIQRRGEEWASAEKTIPDAILSPALQELSRIRAEAFVDTPMVLQDRPVYEIDLSGARPLRIELYPLANGDSTYLLKTSLGTGLVVVRPELALAVAGVVQYLTPPPPPIVRREPAPARAVVTSPAAGAPAISAGTPPATSAPAVAPAPRRTTRRGGEQVQRTIEDEGDLTVHTVRRGESMQSLCRRYDVTPDQVKRWNGLQSEAIVPGMELYVFVRKK
jgi:hypothetical protein